MIQPRRPLAAGVVADHYQELDRHYREIWGEHVHHGLWRTGRETPLEAVEQLIAFVAEQAGIRPGDRVVDIGSGYGAICWNRSAAKAACTAWAPKPTIERCSPAPGSRSRPRQRSAARFGPPGASACAAFSTDCALIPPPARS